MNLVPGFQELLQGFAPAMTSPSFASFCTIAAGVGATKHFSSYHRLLSTASWSLDALGLAVFTMIQPFLGDVVMLGLDDTLARKRGLRMFGTGMHHDPLASTRSLAFVRWGHSWVVLGMIVDFPFRPGHWIFLPLLFRLYVNRQTVAKSPSVTASSASASRNHRAGAARQSNGLPHWPCFSTCSSFSGSPRRGIASGGRPLTVGIPARPPRRSATCSGR